MTTKVTFENENGIYSVQVSKDEMKLGDVWEFLIEPLLLAAGYAQKNIGDLNYPAQSRDEPG